MDAISTDENVFTREFAGPVGFYQYLSSRYQRSRMFMFRSLRNKKNRQKKSLTILLSSITPAQFGTLTISLCSAKLFSDKPEDICILHLKEFCVNNESSNAVYEFAISKPPVIWSTNSHRVTYMIIMVFDSCEAPNHSRTQGTTKVNMVLHKLMDNSFQCSPSSVNWSFTAIELLPKFKTPLCNRADFKQLPCAEIRSRLCQQIFPQQTVELKNLKPSAQSKAQAGQPTCKSSSEIQFDIAWNQSSRNALTLCGRNEVEVSTFWHYVYSDTSDSGCSDKRSDLVRSGDLGYFGASMIERRSNLSCPWCSFMTSTGLHLLHESESNATQRKSGTSGRGTGHRNGISSSACTTVDIGSRSGISTSIHCTSDGRNETAVADGNINNKSTADEIKLTNEIHRVGDAATVTASHSSHVAPAGWVEQSRYAVADLYLHLTTHHTHFKFEMIADQLGNLHIGVRRDRSQDAPVSSFDERERDQPFVYVARGATRRQELLAALYSLSVPQVVLSGLNVASPSGSVRSRNRDSRRASTRSSPDKTGGGIVIDPCEDVIPPSRTKDRLGDHKSGEVTSTITTNAQVQTAPALAPTTGKRLFHCSSSTGTDLSSSSHPSKHSRNSGYIRQYYHARTGLPLTAEELQRDSDDEADMVYELVAAHRALEEFEDVSYEEKEFMKLWNAHVHSFPPYSDAFVPLLCERFVGRFADEIYKRELRHNCLLHLMNMWDFGLLRSDDVRRCMTVVDCRASHASIVSTSTVNMANYEERQFYDTSSTAVNHIGVAGTQTTAVSVSASGRAPSASVSVSASGRAPSASVSVSAPGRAPSASISVSASGRAPSASVSVSASGRAPSASLVDGISACKREPNLDVTGADLTIRGISGSAVETTASILSDIIMRSSSSSSSSSSCGSSTHSRHVRTTSNNFSNPVGSLSNNHNSCLS